MVAVETAIVLPIFFLVLFGFVEISRMFFAANSAQVALIKSARSLSLPGATVADGQAAAQDYLSRVGYGKDRVTVEITPDVITPTTPEVNVAITLSMQPLPFPIRRELTRSRE